MTEKIEALIRSGKIPEAWSLLQHIKPADIPEGSRIIYADFGRRVQQPLYTLKVLGRSIKNHREGIGEADSKEIVAYVHALIKLGFYDESERWIKDLKNAEKLDLKARIHIAQWNYRSAAHYLKRYIKTQEKGSYPWQVSALNRSASLISSGKPNEALPLLRQLKGIARKQKTQLILGNAWELQAQAYLELENQDKARKALNNSMKTLGRTGGIWSFYVKKWELLLQLISQQESVNHLKPIWQSLKLEASEKSYWEDLRELDRAWALVNKDSDMLLKVYFGTPSEFYKKRLLKMVTWKIEIPQTFLFPVLSESKSVGVIFDTETVLSHSKNLYDLFQILTHDMYRPISLGYAFSSLYPEEYFDPFHSPNRVFSVLQRLRQNLQNSGLSVHRNSSGMWLSFHRPMMLPLQKTKISTSVPTRKLLQLRQLFQKHWFQRSDLEKKLKVSESTALRLLSQASEQYQLESEGQGRSRRYRFR